MNLKDNVKPLTYFKSQPFEAIKKVTQTREPMVITQNGEAKGVLVDVYTWQHQQDALALLKTIVIGQKEAQAGRGNDFQTVFERIRNLTRDLEEGEKGDG